MLPMHFLLAYPTCRTLLRIFAVGVLATMLCAAFAAPPRGHPLLGAWTFVVPNTDCTETYRFRSDGTSLVTSGEEVAESTFEVAAGPSPAGFYRWEDTITKDNLKKDCSGAISEIGHSSTNYIRFNPDREMMIICRKESVDECVGPLKRLHGQDS